MPLGPHTNRDTDICEFDTIVSYWCDPGFNFNDKTTVRTILCQEDQNWSSPPPSCSGVIVYINF